MSATTVKLLRAAAEIVGGEGALAERLGVGATLFAKFFSGKLLLPDLLLLRAVDIILEDRMTAARQGMGDPKRVGGSLT